jgi:hypothetical protein
VVRSEGFVPADVAPTVCAAPFDLFASAWPTCHDVHVLSSVLHDWDVPTCEELLRRSFAALAPGGAVLVHEVRAVPPHLYPPLPAATHRCPPVPASRGAVLVHQTQVHLLPPRPTSS